MDNTTMKRQMNNSIRSAGICLGLSEDTIMLFLEQMREYEKTQNTNNKLVTMTDHQYIVERNAENYAKLVNLKKYCFDQDKEIQRLKLRLSLYEKAND